MVAAAQDRVDSIESFYRGAARSWHALITGVGDIAKVVAARPLHDVSTYGRHIAELRRSPGEQCLRKHRVARTNELVMRDVAVAGERPNANAAARKRLDSRERKR